MFFFVGVCWSSIFGRSSVCWSVGVIPPAVLESFSATPTQFDFQKTLIISDLRFWPPGFVGVLECWSGKIEIFLKTQFFCKIASFVLKGYPTGCFSVIRSEGVVSCCFTGTSMRKPSFIFCSTACGKLSCIARLISRHTNFSGYESALRYTT